MIAGTIDGKTSRPFVQGRLLLPRLGVDGLVDFWVDTGATSTVLHPGDASLLAVDYARLRGDVPVLTAGGIALNHVEPALVVFAEANRGLLRAYALRLLIPPPSPANLRLPSLLGLDVVRRWHTRFSPSTPALRFTVVSADWTIRA